MLDPSFFSGAFSGPRRNPNAMGMPEDQGYGGYSGSGTYTLSPDNSVPTSAVQQQQPSRFQGFLSSLQQQGQQTRQNGGLIGAGIRGLARFIL